MNATLSAPCPCCGTILDYGSPITNEEGCSPAHGDLALCFHCATLLEFSEDSYRITPASRMSEIPQQLLASFEKTLHRRVHGMPV